MDRERLLITLPNGIEPSALRDKKVTSTIQIQPELRRETVRRECENLINSIYSDTGGIVVAHWNRQTIKHFDVYAGAGSKKAIAAVNDWINRGDVKSKDSAAWPKIGSYCPAQWIQGYLAEEEEQRAAFFLGPIPDREDMQSTVSSQPVLRRLRN